MTVTWRRPDGERVTLSTLADFSVALENIEAETAKARQEGRYTDIALLNADYQQIFARLRISQRAELQADETHLHHSLEIVEKRLAWWRELSVTDDYDEPIEVSKAQMAIFAPGKMSPASWDEAKAAIAWMPEYRLPDGVDLGRGIADLEQLLEAGRTLQPLFKDFIRQLGDTTFTETGWTEFRKERWNIFVQAVRTYNEIAERIDA
ncbi:MAG: hypothetical protein CL808_00185 [Citromicrobium sp.]|nr:hypothetical protein [Citromicrobium sp.]